MITLIVKSALIEFTDLLGAAMKGCADPSRSNAATSFAIHGSYRLLQEWIEQSDNRLPPVEEADLILELARRVCREG